MELEKIDLVLNEVGENRDRVEKQAGKAQEYLNLKDEKDTLAKGIYSAEYNDRKNILKDENQLKENLIHEINRFENEFNTIEKRLETIDREKLQLKKEIEEISSKNQELKNDIEIKEREKVKLSERAIGYKRELEDRYERVKNSSLKLDEKKGSFEFSYCGKKRS